jgi:hypothetical protein
MLLTKGMQADQQRQHEQALCAMSDTATVRDQSLPPQQQPQQQQQQQQQPKGPLHVVACVSSTSSKAVAAAFFGAMGPDAAASAAATSSRRSGSNGSNGGSGGNGGGGVVGCCEFSYELIVPGEVEGAVLVQVAAEPLYTRVSAQSVFEGGTKGCGDGLQACCVAPSRPS